MRRPSLPLNVVSSWALTSSNVIFALVLTPFVVAALGQEQYGVWSFLNGLAGYSSLLYLGLGTALVREVAARAAAGQDKRVHRIVSVAVTILTGIGTLVMVSAAIASRWIPDLFATDLSTQAAVDASLAFALVGVQLLLLFMTAGYVAALMGRDRYDLANVAQIAITILRAVLVVFGVSGDHPLIRLALVMTLCSAVEFIVIRGVSVRVSESFRASLASPTISELRLLYGFGVPMFMMTLAFRLISHTDTIVIGMMLGASSVGLYALPLQLVDYLRLAIGALPSVMLARLVRVLESGDLAQARAHFVAVAKITSMLAATGVAGLLVLGVPFLESWAGPGFGDPVGWVIVWLGLAMYFACVSTILCLPFLGAFRILMVPAVILICEAVSNLALNIGLIGHWGLEGVAFGTFLPAAMTFVVLPRFVYSRLDLSAWQFLRVTIGPGLTVSSAVGIALLVLSRWISPTSAWSCAVLAGCALPAAALASIPWLAQAEREWLFGRGARMARRLLKGGGG